MKIEYYPNMTGMAGTQRTINVMERLIKEGTRDATVIDTAQQLVRGVNQKDYFAQAQKLFSFIRNKVQYVRDPVGVEFVKTPLKTLYDRTGDCDDQAVLFSALARAIGFRTRLKAIKSDPRWPSEFSHVYSQVQIPGKGWVTADTIVPGKSLGWEAPKERQFGSRVWDSEAGMFGQYDVDTGASSFGDGIVSSSDLDYDVEGAGEAFGAAGFGFDVEEGADAFGADVSDIADELAMEDDSLLGLGFDVDEGMEGWLRDALSNTWNQIKRPATTGLLQNLLGGGQQQTAQQQAAAAAAAAAAAKPAWQKYLPVAALGAGALILTLIILKRKKRR